MATTKRKKNWYIDFTFKDLIRNWLGDEESNLCPLWKTCKVFKELLQQKNSVHNPFIKAYQLIRIAEEEK
jgi:hypothetical protein